MISASGVRVGGGQTGTLSMPATAPSPIDTWSQGAPGSSDPDDGRHATFHFSVRALERRGYPILRDPPLPSSLRAALAAALLQYQLRERDNARTHELYTRLVGPTHMHDQPNDGLYGRFRSAAGGSGVH